MKIKLQRGKIIKGTVDRPRLSVFRSNKSIYAQIIDDQARKTLVAASSAEVKSKGVKRTEVALLVGENLAKKAAVKGVKKVVFDRKKYKYHGRVKALADGAKKGGLDF